jgi:hypothetical protein
MRNFRVSLAIAAWSALGLSCCPAGAQAVRVDGIRLVDVGAYSVESSQPEKAETPTGAIHWNTGVRLIDRSTTICPRPGSMFGMRYVVEGAPLGAEVQIRVVVRFPAPGMRNPHTGQTSMLAEHSFSRNIGATRFTNYAIGEDWEAVPGVWAIELWRQNRKLLEQDFTLDTSACHVS